MSFFKPILIAGCLLVAFVSQGSASIQVNDFTGVYDVANWTADTEGNSRVDTTGAPSAIQLIGSDEMAVASRTVSLTITAACDGLFEFDWDYFSNDRDEPFYDPAFYINDSLFKLTNDSGPLSQSGSISVAVTAGATIGWSVTAIDAAEGLATLDITNFSAPAPSSGAVPEPSSLIVWGLLGAVGLKRRRHVA